jgi:hypothetical protein
MILLSKRYHNLRRSSTFLKIACLEKEILVFIIHSNGENGTWEVELRKDLTLHFIFKLVKFEVLNYPVVGEGVRKQKVAFQRPMIWKKIPALVQYHNDQEDSPLQEEIKTLGVEKGKVSS